MATILEFRASGEPQTSVADADRTAESTTESAQIIIFPGVRIERYDLDPFEDAGSDLNSVAKEGRTSKV